MGDAELNPMVSKSFQRELELLNAMVPADEDDGGILDKLKNLGLEEEESKAVVYGPLSEAFYVVNCPFAWSEYVSKTNIESYITTTMDKLDWREEDWKTFCIHLYFGFLYGRLGKLKDAFKNVDICDEHLNKHSEEDFYKEIMNGLRHGIQATRAHLHYLNGEAEVADEIISSLVPVKELNKPSKAALIAANAEIMQEFGPTYKEMAVKMMETAIKLDPDDEGFRRGSWYYTAGKMYGQLRRMEHRAGMPSQKELQMLERATRKNPYPISLATLADSYREASAAATFSHKGQVSADVCNRMISEAKLLYKRAFEMDDQSYRTLRRCGNGLMKLPAHHKDLPLAKQCLEKAVNLNPKCAAAYQALGTMEEKFFQNLNKALRYFQLSYDNGNLISGSFIVQVRMKMDRNYNPIEDIDKFIEDVAENRNDLKVEFLVLKGEYLFFLKNDLLAASNFWKEAIKMAPESENVKNHTCRFLTGKRIRKPYLIFTAGRCVLDVYKCLKYEVRNVMGTANYSNEEIEDLKALLNL